MISIHALLAESDLWVLRKVPILGIFLSTLSLRRATRESTSIEPIFSDFYPRSPCGERLNDAINGCNPDFISIHALLAESDTWARGSRVTYVEISIHALLAESDRFKAQMGEFLNISIHALLAESDPLGRAPRKGV